MRSLYDVNALIALLDRNHSAHNAVSAWFARNIEQGWASCPLTQNGCLRILSQPRYPRLVSLYEALELGEVTSRRGRVEDRSEARPRLEPEARAAAEGEEEDAVDQLVQYDSHHGPRDDSNDQCPPADGHIRVVWPAQEAAQDEQRDRHAQADDDCEQDIGGRRLLQAPPPRLDVALR